MTPIVTRHPPPRPGFKPGHPVISRARDLMPGDIILVHSHAKLSPKLIGFGQRRHHPPEFAYWTHAAIYVGKVSVKNPLLGGAEMVPQDTDWLIEAKGGSPVRYVPLAQYDVRDYAAIRFDLPNDDDPTDGYANTVLRGNAVAFLEAQLGKRYEYLADVNLGLWSLLGGTRFLMGGAHSWFCSDLAAASAMYLGVVWSTSPLGIMPADIAEKFGIRR